MIALGKTVLTLTGVTGSSDNIAMGQQKCCNFAVCSADPYIQHISTV